MKLNTFLFITFGICLLNGHSHDESEHDFETINDVTFQERVIGYNYTQEKIGGKHVKYYITDNGNWHIDACSVIGNQKTGLKGLYRRLADDENHRRLNPYYAGTLNGKPNGWWENGILYYEIAHPTLNMYNFNLAIEKYMTQSPVRLVAVTDDIKNNGGEWVRIIQGSGCWSYIGRVARGSNANYIGQDLSLGAGCDGSLATIMHEFGHALGFFHTQARSDRDQYVNVNLANIRDDRESQYAIVYYPVCGEYDCNSMMHYRTNSFATCATCITMTAVDPTTCTIQRNYADPLSSNDRYCLCELYPPGVNGQTSSNCHNGVPEPTIPPTGSPTPLPTTSPLESTHPTESPTPKPSATPTETPTVAPTKTPTAVPTRSPITESQLNGFCLQGGSKTTSNHEDMIGFWSKQEFSDNNGNIYFKNERISCNNEALYIYQTTTLPIEWYMSNTLNGNAFRAKCVMDSVYNCGNNWQFNGIIDTNLNLVEGNCIKPECETLQITTNDLVDVNSIQLDGTYTKSSDNTYENSYYVVQYNDFYEQWISYDITNKNNINDCDNTDSIILGKSIEGVLANVGSNADTPYTWSGEDGAQAFFKCVSISPTEPPVTPSPRPVIQCDDVVSGMLGADDEMVYSFSPPNTGYAMAFHSCNSLTSNGVDVQVRTENLVDEIITDNYGAYWCSQHPDRATRIFWQNNANTGFIWSTTDTYTIRVSGVSGGGPFSLNIWCYGNQADALNFGKNEDGEYVPIFSFKAYGPVQWGIFFGILIAIIIINILGCYFITKCMIKMQKKANSDETHLTDHNNAQQNIELTPDDNFDGYPTQTR